MDAEHGPVERPFPTTQACCRWPGGGGAPPVASGGHVGPNAQPFALGAGDERILFGSRQLG